MKKYLSYSSVVVILALIAVACQKNDHNYVDIIKDGEINYTGKVDSVKASPGINRIQFTYLLKSDPKIVKVVIYWNNFMDSVVQPIVRSPNVDTITTMINNIPEGSYTFTFITYGANGNASIRQEAASTVYGPNYIALLGNRPRVTSEFGNSGNAVISWFIADPSVIGTEIKYTDNANTLRTVIAPASDLETILPNYKLGTTYELRTLHQPEQRMIDTLKTSVLTLPLDNLEVTATYFPNPGGPFRYNTWDGVRYGTLKDWTVTSAAGDKIDNKPGGFGSYDNIGNSASMNTSRFGDGTTPPAQPAITHGKIFRSFSLPAGTYRFIMYFDDSVNVGTTVEPPFSGAGAAAARVVVASGSTLPSAAPTTANTRAFTTINTKSTAIFTLTATTVVAMGLYVNYPLTVEGYVRASRVKLLKEM